MKRQTLIRVVLAGGLIAALAPAYAGQNAASVEYHRQRQEAQRAERPAPPPPRADAAPPRGPAPQSRPPRGSGNTWRAPDNRGRNVVVGPPRGSAGAQGRIVPPSRVITRPEPPRTVHVLPPGHRRYDWRGTPYYWAGGHWYRPYRNSYVIVSAPLGLFLPSLPVSYTTLWVGGTRYYYADGSYFIYEPARRGYVVTRSPYGDDEDEYHDDYSDQDLYIYPMRGQSEEQQAEDRYQCHRWAADQTHYDPTLSGYDPDKRENYDRAMTACLTGRGYSVK